MAAVAGVFVVVGGGGGGGGGGGRLYQFDQLSRWLERERLGVGELTGGQAERFAAARRAAGLVTWAARQSVMLPLGYLRALGVAPAPAPVVARGPLEELLADYRRYLSIERGLCDHTVLDAYEPVAHTLANLDCRCVRLTLFSRVGHQAGGKL